MNMKRVWVGVLALALLVPLRPALAADPIVIGDVLATTGPYEHYGQEEITIIPKVIFGPVSTIVCPPVSSCGVSSSHPGVNIGYGKPC